MEEIVRLIIGSFILIIGFPIGSFLSRMTKEELKTGQKWFKLIIIISLISGAISVFLRNDVLLFSFFFIAIVTSRSLR